MSTCCLTVKTNRNPQKNFKYRSRLRSPGGCQVVLSSLPSVSLLLVRISLLSFTSFSLFFHFKNTNFHFIFEQERDEKWATNIINNNKMGKTRLLFFLFLTN